MAAISFPVLITSPLTQCLEKRPVLPRQERTVHRRRIARQEEIKISVRGNRLCRRNFPVFTFLHFSQNRDLQCHPRQPGPSQEVEISAFFNLLDGLLEVAFRDRRLSAGQEISLV